MIDINMSRTFCLDATCTIFNGHTWRCTEATEPRRGMQTSFHPHEGAIGSKRGCKSSSRWTCSIESSTPAGGGGPSWPHTATVFALLIFEFQLSTKVRVLNSA